jgi:histidine triad (HIT) family protein
MDCLFCAIIKGDIPSNKVYEDESCYAFLDINPQAKVHCLVVPKAHIASANEIGGENAAVVAHIFTKIPVIAEKLGLMKYKNTIGGKAYRFFRSKADFMSSPGE